MKEAQLHQAFSIWLTKNKLAFVHARTDRRSTMTQSWPDYTICHVGKCLLVEIKTEKGALTAGQKELFAKIGRESGMVVHVARSVEQAVSAVETWLGVERPASVDGDKGPRKTCDELHREIVEGPRSGSAYEVRVTPKNPADAFILTFAGKDAVFTGDPSPGGSVAMVRVATASDLINLPRR